PGSPGESLLSNRFLAPQMQKGEKQITCPQQRRASSRWLVGRLSPRGGWGGRCPGLEGQRGEGGMSLAEEMGSVKALHGLGEAHLQKLAAIARPRECPVGAVLFREGDESSYIFVLLSGTVTLEVKMRDRGPTAIYAAGPGELLGWSPVLGRHSMTATAKV